MSTASQLYHCCKADSAREKFAEALKACVRVNPHVQDETRNRAIDEEMVTIFDHSDSDDEPPAAGAAVSALERLGGGESAKPRA